MRARLPAAPRFPRKIFASVLTGLGLGLAGLGASMAEALVFRRFGRGVAFLRAFGADPMRDKGMEGIDAHQTDRAARAVEEAEETLAEIGDAIRRAGDRALVDRVARFFQTPSARCFAPCRTIRAN